MFIYINTVRIVLSHASIYFFLVSQLVKFMKEIHSLNVLALRYVSMYAEAVFVSILYDCINSRNIFNCNYYHRYCQTTTCIFFLKLNIPTTF